MLLDVDIEDLAWVLDYTAESEETDSEDCVVRAARRLILQLGEQLPPLVMDAIDDLLEDQRGFRLQDMSAMWRASSGDA
jgi:hypothetical protein